MVHALKPTRKLGFGLLSPQACGRLNAAVEAGYLIGSLLFTVGTLFFFPVDFLEDFTLGCRFYEVGSLVFMLLTLYTELDSREARRRADEQCKVTRRDLLEQLLYCGGSVVFLVGTFLFDPPLVKALAHALHIHQSAVENTAAVLFMIGSFMFSFGSYVNALSIFEAPRIYRSHLLTVTTCFQFGGLSFVAGTMGYVEAFEPNNAMKWCATWMFMIGCFFYVFGTGLSFIRTVASQQLSWELKTARRDAKRCQKEMKMASLVGNATPGNGQDMVAKALEEGCLGVLEDSAEAGSPPPRMPSGDMQIAEQRLAKQVEDVLGLDAGRELVAALQDRDDGLLDEEDLFGAFWRSVFSTPAASPEVRDELGSKSTSQRDRDSLPFL